MNVKEYTEIMSSLRKKLKKGQLSNRQSGYRDGITSAMSVVRSAYKRDNKEEQ